MLERREWLLRRQDIIDRLYGIGTKVYGPYVRKDGRTIVSLKNGARSYIRQFSKLKMEILLGKTLHKDEETVHHIDRDVLNDSLSNLEVIPRKEHCKKDAQRVNYGSAVCPICCVTFQLTRYQHQRIYQAGPFCSRKCLGKYGAEIQNGRMKKKERTLVHKSKIPLA